MLAQDLLAIRRSKVNLLRKSKNIVLDKFSMLEILDIAEARRKAFVFVGGAICEVEVTEAMVNKGDYTVCVVYEFHVDRPPISTSIL